MGSKPMLSGTFFSLPRRILLAPAKRVMGTVTSVQTQDSVVALTFDDGPHPKYTPRLLEVLERHGAKATFFMIGKNALAHPDLVRQVAAAGHVIGNHTYDHPAMIRMSRYERLRQLQRCRKVLKPYGQHFFRPPYGGQTAGSRFDAFLCGYEVVAWSAAIGDWREIDRTIMVDRLNERVKNGFIVLLHDRGFRKQNSEATDRSELIAALDIFLGDASKTFRFVTIPELMRCGKVIRSPWFKAWPEL